MKQVFLQIIAEWLEDELVKDIIKRNIKLPDPTTLSEILAITGPRRAGKTYLMYQMISELISTKKYSKDNILFVDFEDYRLSGIKPANIEELLTAFVKLTKNLPKFIFFDEIQHLPEWGRVLRTLHNQRKYKIIVSGSNSELLSKEVATELRGRYFDILVLPYSFNEFLKQQKIEYNKRTQFLPDKGEILATFEIYLKNGGFPEVIAKKSNREKRLILKNYFNTIFFNDIIERYNIKMKYILNEMMKYGINTFSQLFSISKFEKYLKSSGMSASKRTISNYLHYLESAYFFIVNEKFSYSPRKRLMNPKKLYMFDLGFSSLGMNFSENKGHFLENIVAIDLFRKAENMFYYKESRELDFIIVKNSKPDSAIQVCWELNERNIKRELEALIEVKEKFMTRNNFILTFDQDIDIEYKNHSFKTIPVWKWLIYESEAE